MFDTWRTQAVDVTVYPREAPERPWLGRYEALHRLGVGAFGEVWLANDLILQEQVAIKRLTVSSSTDVDRLRRETTALRVAQVPGVVRVRDDFRQGSEAFIVMDVVTGRPFGEGGPHPWPVIEGPTHALLATLARLHFAGLVHRDLKPTNILVDARNNPVVLDLGVASGRGVAAAARPGGFEGTRYYAAPEQLMGGVVDARADMYALGAMLFEVLVGRASRTDASSVRSSTGGPISGAPRAEEGLATLPPRVAALLRRLLAEDPDDRPDAVEALRILGGSPPLVPPDRLLVLPERATPEALKVLFHGPDVYLHLCEDAAAALHRRTGGRRDRVGAELDAWLRAGLAVWEDGAARVKREAIGLLETGAVVRIGGECEVEGAALEVLRAVRLLGREASFERVVVTAGMDLAAVGQLVARLEARDLMWRRGDGTWDAEPMVDGSAPDAERRAMALRALSCLPADADARVRLLVEIDAPWQEIVDALGRRCDRLLAAGSYDDCLTRVELAAAIARARPDGELPRAARVSGTAAACLLGGRYGLERMRLLLEQGDGGAETSAALSLIRVYWLARNSQPEEARQLVDQLQPFEDPQLEFCRVVQTVLLMRAPDPSAAERWLEQQVGLQETTRFAAMGHIRYAQGRYREAAEAHAACARLFSWPIGLGNVSAAWMDAGELEKAAEAARACWEIAAGVRAAPSEARAHYLLRAARYRQGLRVEVDAEGTQVSAYLDPACGALHAVIDAALAWRSGDRYACAAAARSGRVWSQGRGLAPMHLLLRALLAWAESPADEDLVTLLDDSERLGPPGVRVQVAGLLEPLLATSGHAARGQSMMARALCELDPASVHMCREVMSANEAMRAYGSSL
jgi:hypothetical protein